MNIDHPVAPCLHEIRVQYAHEAGKADELDPVLAKPPLRLNRKGAPVEVFPGPVTGLPLPARAEIILEGELLPINQHTLPEGPFGEFTGYG